MLRSVFTIIAIIICGLVSSASSAIADDKRWKIGWLSMNPRPIAARPNIGLAAFRQGLDSLGYLGDRSYVIYTRFADTDRLRLPGLAKELVDAGVDIIVTIGTPPVRAAKEATTTIPIVMAGSESPVENGLVASLAHPGGNVTGLTHNADSSLKSKGLELLKITLPNISRVAILHAEKTIFSNYAEEQETVNSLKIVLLYYNIDNVESVSDLNKIFTQIIEDRAEAIFVDPSFKSSKYRDEIVEFVMKNKLPCTCQEAELAKAGCLFSYYTDFIELRRRAAVYVDKILKGAKPSDLPVERPTKFQLIVNLKTAKALDLTVPLSLLASADELIE
jgi:putative tryptophan/tyrosine transport system substrate-binding protein